MAVHAVGDVQGCREALERLLERLRFDPARDRLWLTGDLVNRGPDSAGVLRLLRGLGGAVVAVLGNHDLHLLAVARGHQPLRPEDTFCDLLEAPDAAELLDWLRHRPLLHYDADLGACLVHAGLPPCWELEQAAYLAREVEGLLRGERALLDAFLARLHGDRPERWDEGLHRWDRWRYVVNALTRMRCCDASGRLLLADKGPPGSQPGPFRPWFEQPAPWRGRARVLFGHWAALGLHLDPRGGVYGLDSGCAWAGRLSALRLDGPKAFAALEQVSCAGCGHPAAGC